MQYRPLGNTGLNVSVVALGCAGLENGTRESVAERMNYALEHGVNFLDLFSSDPSLRSNIGEAISAKRDKWIIQGHIGSAWVDGQYMRTRDMDKTKEAFADLLARLKTDYIDIGMIHYVDGEKDWDDIANGPFMEYLQSLKREGKIKHTGIGSHNPLVAIKAVESGLIDVLMFAVNPCYDMQPGDEDLEKLWADESYAGALHNQDAARKRLYELCESRGVGVDVMKAYGGGDLLNAELSPFKKAFTVPQCLHYALTRPAVAAVMCGCKTTEELDAALEYLYSSEEERDYSAVLSGLDRHTFSGHCLYCGHCAPCPVGIDVASVTKYLNLALAQGSVPATERGHYALLSHHGGECIECGGCETRCPFGVKIMDNMKKAAKTFGK